MAALRFLAVRKRVPFDVLHFDAAGKLSMQAAQDVGFDEYVSDPDKPVPVTGEIGAGMPGDYMTYDQRFASRRPDVLVYQTEPLDHDVTIVGPVTPVLSVSTTGTDSDFDREADRRLSRRLSGSRSESRQGPHGRLPAAGARRALSRKVPQQLSKSASRSFPASAPRRSNSDARCLPHLPPRPSHHGADPEHLVPAGRTAIRSSSWTSRTAKSTDFQKATERVYRGGTDGSGIRVYVLE